ncbi:type VII secretion target [Actinocrispum wychmicini]|uniref:Excreted virulence factor EspC (Type VII ESX diderm) n=1 Tax=Actinocrispum wychmicini TaxID=1213861 RepID=A0A4R2J9K7_9PSEU|nr:type VII secretion target [Actinocrispum wychmicini]TCO56013.1 excreted virulence factor EspC (type VII ESX diderm) [Actinocrispum wychmicini]
MPAGFEVESSALVTHAQHLGGVLDQLQDALAAALAAHLSPSAFGPCGGPIAAMVAPLAETAQEAFRSGVESVAASRTGVHATAVAYDQVDSYNAAELS